METGCVDKCYVAKGGLTCGRENVPIKIRDISNPNFIVPKSSLKPITSKSSAQMDHIPRPHNAIGTPFDFSYVAVEEYDKGSFLAYPNRKGFESQDSNFHRSNTPTSRAAFLQTWLFFGLLYEFLENDYTNDRHWTSVNDAQGIVLCTRNLAVATTQHWDKRHEKEERARHLMTCFDRAFEVVSLACEFHGADAQALMSVAILVNFLSGVIRPLSGPSKDIPPEYWSGYSWPGQMVDSTKKKLRSHGWCPSEMTFILENLDISIACVQLEPPNPQFRHAECNDRFCETFSAHSNMMTYPEPGHIVDGCDCAWFELDVNKAHDILLGGNLPVILVANNGQMWKPRIGLSDPGKLNVTIKSSNDVVNYVAFSHVWSDGLGNPHSNRLRVCRLAHLQKIASEIGHQKTFSEMRARGIVTNCPERLFIHENEPPTPFWIDTICCPTHPPEAKDLGIKMLQQTYKGAGSVVVLDSYLQRGVFSKTTDQEILLRLECSRWMHRLWTLREGILAKELFLQFSDGPVGYFGVFRRFRDLVDQGDVVARNLLTNFVLTNKVFSKDLFDPEISKQAASSVLYRTLQYRSTTVKSDEAICIANTLGLDIEKVLQAGKDSQLAMSVIWKLLPHIDCCVIFSTTPKLKIPGFGWAPETFLDPDGFPETRSEAATLTEDGLETRHVLAYSYTRTKRISGTPTDPMPRGPVGSKAQINLQSLLVVL
ncbi:hypothetical protein DL98DRAFT_572010 [Cadophora sp. DSE1049]|nr:hypothetical protein DL98DRAFT_572010 [Cadophora sp. DSE1049]